MLGLAALIRLAEARRPARLDADGVMIPLTEQDPALWRADKIAEAAQVLNAAAALGRTGPYQLLAAIHGAHATRRETGVTPWADIAALYEALMMLRPSPVVALNQAVALGEAKGAAVGLEALERLEGLEGFAPWHAARGHLLADLGRAPEAAAALAMALELIETPAERRFLERRRAALQA